MKILLTGGGTAGHVTPLLAVASKIAKTQPDATIRYVGKIGDSLSVATQDHASIQKTYAIAAGKLRRYHGKSFWWYFTQPGLLFHNLKDLLLLGLGFVHSIGILLFWRPDVVFVKGGYVGLPVGLAAAVLRIPIVTHDSDVLPGLTNRILSKFAKALAVGMPVEYYPQYNGRHVVYTGVPVREQFSNVVTANNAKQQLDLAMSEQVVTIVGGSLGAVRVNNAIYDAIGHILTQTNITLLWYCGETQYKELVAKLKAMDAGLQKRVHLYAYSDKLEISFAASDVVISRAGATTIAELALMGKPSIIIPNPLLTGGHQLKNARILQDANAAIVLTEDEITDVEHVASTIKKLVASDSAKASLAAAIHKLAHPNAANDIANLVIDSAKTGNHDI